nr:MAG TPA: hypothetical protein [Caudoviricetes sp.]
MLQGQCQRVPIFLSLCYYRNDVQEIFIEYKGDAPCLLFHLKSIFPRLP